MPQPIHIRDVRLTQYLRLFWVCHFLRVAPWSVDQLTAVRQAYFYEQMAPVVAAAHLELRAQQPRRRGRRKRTVVTGYLILDDNWPIRLASSRLRRSTKLVKIGRIFSIKRGSDRSVPLDTARNGL